MGQVESKENSVTGERSYPAGHDDSRRENEIDLVDLWIVLWSYRKIFLSSMILFAVVGILYFEFAYKAKPGSTSKVSSIIEIESILSNRRSKLVADPDAVIKKIRFVMLPRFSSLNEFTKIKQPIINTKVSRFNNRSQIIEIVSKVPGGDVVDISRFHDQLVENVLLELNKFASSLPNDVHNNLFSDKIRIVKLKELIITLEQKLLARANEQVNLEQALLDRVNSELTLEQLREKVHFKAASYQALQVDLALKKVNMQSEIEILTERIRHTELMLSNAGSRVLVKAGVSRNSSERKKSKAYFIILMSSLFLALFLTVGVIFSRKVKERMAAGD